MLPAVTVTDPGTVKPAALLDSPTTAPPLPAAFDSVTVQLALPPVPRVAGLHAIPLTSTDAASTTFAVCVLPFSVAVTTTV